jgi:hypothetical protein
MSSTDKERHRDREPGRRDEDEPSRREADRVFRMTGEERQEIAKALRLADEARLELESRHSRENREILRKLRAAADRIFDVLSGLDEID